MDFKNKFYTVESVTAGHPDKVCDQISDAILDECLRQDPGSRVAMEAFGCHDLIVVGGELTTSAEFNAEKIARKVYSDIGYKDADKMRFITEIIKQSPDIAQGVDTGGAGDQGILYGYATDETKEFLPYGLVLVHKPSEGLEKLRKSGEVAWLRPDGKSQVTMDKGRVKTVLISTQHDEGVSQEEIRETLIEKLIKPLGIDESETEIFVNPTGKFVVGGFIGDTGLTGRKIMVDTYGGLIPHGGGCFSGKDSTKVDRSAAYMARHAAKNIVANGHAKSCVVSLAYAIGHDKPLMVEAINEKGESIGKLAEEKFDFSPRAIVDYLDLRRDIFQPTACYGHFGKDGLPWEEIKTW